MKLAEALQERADLNRKIEQLENRLLNNCMVQEGEEPVEDPKALLKELAEATQRFADLVQRINLTNNATLVDGKTITQLIAEKDSQILHHRILRNLINETSQIARRASRTEIKILPTVDVPSLQKIADVLAREIRQMDNRLQEQNWLTELR